MKNFRRLKIWEQGMEIALGSAFELETQLLIIRDSELANPVDAECLRRRLRQPKADKLIERLHEEQRMINSFIKH